MTKKKKTLSVLALGFIRMFFVRKRVISLEEAAKFLSSPFEQNKIKTKIRRLYDIANVFQALGLIVKT
jgi:transcription factor E2F7/8